MQPRLFCILSICFLWQTLSAQCPVAVSAGNDLSICEPGGTSQLNGAVTGNYLGFAWSPVTGLSDPASLSPIATIGQATTYTLTATALDPQNLIPNADFEAGNMGFTSGYSWSDCSLMMEGLYAILTQAFPCHAFWETCGDHTTGDGLMMLVNGIGTPGTEVWCQTVPVNPNTQYAFSCWAMSEELQSQAELQFFINGQLIGPVFTPLDTCLWQQFYAIWDSGNATAADICILNQNIEPSGNDFALDDLFFGEICTVSDSVTVEVVGPIPPTFLYSTTCDAAQTGFFSQTLNSAEGCDSIVITTISLQQSDTTWLSGVTCDPEASGIFTQCLTSQNGCDSIVISSISLQESNSVEFFTTTCDSAAAGIFTQFLTNQYGCDSTVVATITFVGNSPTMLYATTCHSSEVGVFTYTMPITLGCDSIVVETVALLPSTDTVIFGTICDTTQAGVSTAFFTAANGCDSIVTTVVTFLGIDSTAMFSTTCNPALAGIFSQTLTNAGGCDSIVIETVELLPSSSTTTFGTTCNPAMAGTTTQIFNATNGCDSIVTTTLTFVKNDSVFLFSTTCDPSQAGVFTQILSTIEGCDSIIITAIEWVGNNLTEISQTTCDSTETGIFTQQLTNQFGCDSIITTTIDFQSFTVFVETTSPCPDENNGVITIEVGGGNEPYLFALNTGAFQTGNQFGELSPGFYEITVQDAAGCEQSLVTFIESAVPLSLVIQPGDTTIFLGDSLPLIAEANFPIENLYWEAPSSVGLSCLDCPNPIASPQQTQSFTLFAISPEGCAAQASITITVEQSQRVFVPNVFSPNGDGINDGFTVFGDPKKLLNIKHLLVFDRWGNMVFHGDNFPPNDSRFGWDGSFRGKNMNPAVFVWWTEVELVNGKTEFLEGGVTLVR